MLMMVFKTVQRLRVKRWKLLVVAFVTIVTMNWFWSGFALAPVDETDYIYDDDYGHPWMKMVKKRINALDTGNVSINLPPEASPTCPPVQHIMFLKTHRCGASSIQNILLRYSYKHNLTVALPPKGTYMGSPEHFKAEMVAPYLLPSSGKADVFALNTRLNVHELDKVLHPDSVYITVLRDPPSVFESIYHYYELSEHGVVSLGRLLQQSLEEQLSFGRVRDRFGYNMMLYDMGVDVHPRITAIEVRQAISAADKLFELVLIAEQLDQSLILLKDRFCWSFKDIVFFDKKVRKGAEVPELPDDMINKMKILNSADGLLYKHFLDKHKLNVLTYGEIKMAEQVALLKLYKKYYFTKCGVRYIEEFPIDSRFKEESNLVISYVTPNITVEECLLLTLPENDLIETVRERMLLLRNSNLNEPPYNRSEM